MGLIPDFATIRDRAVVHGNKIRATIYNALTFGWKGAAKTWSRYESVALILGRSFNTAGTFGSHHRIHGLCDFGYSRLAHDDLPAILRCRCDLLRFRNGLTLMLVTRKVFRLEDYITIYHIELMNKIIIVTGSIVGMAYITELFIAWYSGVEYERYAFYNRVQGPLCVGILVDDDL